jgi:demethylmenaquinone methyltransferase/2-methoxy-6-polyprenyl-1,4-benzoquinol methylase
VAPVILDLAAGTGDFCKLVSRQYPGARAIAVDLTERMLSLAKQSGVSLAACADAGALPFRDGCFDCAFVGYGLRNFPDLPLALSEIERVIRPGGLLVTLDFFLPANRLFRTLLGLPVRPGNFLGASFARPPADVHLHSRLAKKLSVN